jgi:UDP-2-acetamido-3-amino-2,3-dideoxy-glucuronate N-acetyltransferase
VGKSSARPGKSHIFPMCLIDDPVSIGPFTEVQPFTRIMANTIIGAYVNIGQHVSIGEGVMIGNNVIIQHNVVLDGVAILEDNVTCGACSVFAPMALMRAEREVMPSLIKPTLVRRGSYIGPNTTIAQGVSIGRYTFIEAGSVVDTTVYDYQVVLGNPLTLMAWRCQCGNILGEKNAIKIGQTLECSACGKVYLRRAAQSLVLLETERHDSHTGPYPSKCGPSA